MSKWRLGLLEKGKTERFFIWIIDETDICQPINFISSISISVFTKKYNYQVLPLIWLNKNKQDDLSRIEDCL